MDTEYLLQTLFFPFIIFLKKVFGKEPGDLSSQKTKLRILFVILLRLRSLKYANCC